MASVISAGTTSSTSLNLTADTSGVLQLASNNGTVAMSISTAQVVSFTNQPTFTGGTANGVAYLNGSKILTTGSALTFDGTNGATTGNWTAGNLLSTAGGYLRVNRSDNATYNEIKYVTSGDLFYFNQANGGAYQFNITGTEYMRLTSTGLGIGTSSPGDKLEVYSTITARASSGTSALRLRNTTTDMQWQSVAGTNAINLYDNAAGATRLTVDSSGNLGLGVTPSAWFANSRVLQITTGVSLEGRTNDGSSLSLGGNYYLDSAATYRYLTSNFAQRYTQAAGAHIWYNAASGTAGTAITFTQAMTLDASGRLGLGETSPSYMIDVKAPSSGDTTIRLTKSGSINTTINAVSGAMTFGVDASGGTTERARIDSSGNLLVGTTSVFNGTNSPLQVSNSAANQVLSLRNTNATPYGQYVLYSGASPNNSANEFLYCSDTTAQRFTARSNGGLANYSANNANLSDRREKTNFAPSKSYIDVICAIPVQTFNYIDQNMEDDPGLTLGVVAQDVQAVAPELVSESNWGTKEEPKMRLSIYQTDLQYALMKCIQEQQALIETLTTRITALEAK